MDKSIVIHLFIRKPPVKIEKCVASNEATHEKRRAPFVATQTQSTQEECDDGDCVFTEAKTILWTVHYSVRVAR